MSQIPEPVRDFLSMLAQPGTIANASGFRVMCAVQAKLLARNALLPSVDHPNYLSLNELDELALAVKPQISVALPQEDIEFLAEKLVQAFDAMRGAFAEQRFRNPTAAAIEMMKQFVVQF